jgi:very-short-patch-repair endonuclease
MGNEDKPRQFTSSPTQWRKLKQRTRDLRQNPTPAEDALWQRLRKRSLGVQFRRQHTIEGFIVDFVCIRHDLVIEVDGPVHDDVDQQAYDKSRQALIESKGFRVLRFSNADVMGNIEKVLDKIQVVLEAAKADEGDTSSG